MNNFMILSCLAAMASASYYSGPGLATWPSVGGYGASSTCWGCHGYRIGKRSADASYGYGAALTLQNQNRAYGHELASGYSISQPHPGVAGSFQSRTQLHSGLSYGYGSYGGYGKRSADASLGYGVALTLENRNNVHGHELGSQYAIAQPHPAGQSYQQVSRLHSGLSHGYGGYGGYGVYGKRSADASLGYGVALTLENRNNVHGHELGSQYAIAQPHPAGQSYQQVSRLHTGYLGYGKRSADASYGYGAALTLQNQNRAYGHELASGYSISQPHPGAAGSFQSRTQLHSGLSHGYGGYGVYGKRSADASYGYGAALTLQNQNRAYGHELASGYSISQPHPGVAGSFQSRTQLHSGLSYGYGGLY